MPPVSCTHLLATIVRDFASRPIVVVTVRSLGRIVLLSGPADYLSDGSTVIRMSQWPRALGSDHRRREHTWHDNRHLLRCGKHGYVRHLRSTCTRGHASCDRCWYTRFDYCCVACCQQRRRTQVRNVIACPIDELRVLTPEIVLRMAKIEMEIE